MAIIAMLVLAAGSSSYIYVANRNVNLATEFNNGLQAQYSAEAAIRIVVEAGKESVKKANGYAGGNSALDDWAKITTDMKKVDFTLPGKMGSAKLKVTGPTATGRYTAEALSSVNNASRLLVNRDFSPINIDPAKELEIKVTTASLIASAKQAGKTWFANSDTGNKTNYGWILPTNLNSETDPAKSPGFNDVGAYADAWKKITSQVLFDDTLGYSTYQASENLELVFRVNTYIKLVDVPSDKVSGSGYGVYYLAEKNNLAGAANPTSYIVQFDPGLHPGYGSPPGGTAWGAAYGTSGTGVGNASDWPYGAFLVKKTKDKSVIGSIAKGPQNEVWDESGTYNDHCGFQDNNEWIQQYYNTAGTKQTLDLANSSTWALQPVSTTPSTTAPTLTRVPTSFGITYTGKYRNRPPDLRIPYTLGDIAEGNPWRPKTYYPVGAKVAVGVWVDKPIDNRMVWVATVAGVSGSTSKLPTTSPQVGDQVINDGGVTWTAQKAPTPKEVAKSILAKGSFSVAKISMADVNFRVNSVNGTTSRTDPYSVPFTMLKGSKNKITVELWADSNGNRIHIIKVNDVLVLGFNDKYVNGKINIIPENWELNPSAVPRGTGLRVWNAKAEFYTTDNYGRTISTATSGEYGDWGR